VGHAVQKAARGLSKRHHGRVAALALASLLAGSASASPAAAGGTEPAPAETPLEARLTIDTHAAGPGAEVLYRRIEERANLVLRYRKVLPGDDSDPLVAVRVQARGGDEPGYAITIALTDAAGRSLADARVVDCALCTETELVARVEAELAEAIVQLRRTDPAARETDEAARETDETGEVAHAELAPAPTIAPDPRRPRSGLFVAGVSVLAIGGAAAATGIGLAIPPARIDPDHPLDKITTRPIGYGLIAGGAALVISGAIMAAVASKRGRVRTVAAGPWLGERAAGVAWGARF
jgi:hypothetical protein